MAGAGRAGQRPEGRPALVRGLIAGAALAVLLVAIVLLLVRGSGYEVTAEFTNAGQLVRGNEVKTAGATIGSVGDIEITRDGRAEVTLEIKDDDYDPLRRGTRALIKQASLSGIANRYVDLHLGEDGADEIADGGRIGAEFTETAVELDQVFSLFDKEARTGLQDFFEGSAQSLEGRGGDIRRGVRNLSPALSTGTRLFEELSRDEPLLERFLVDSSALVSALAERREELSGVVSNLGATFGALGNQQEALGESIARLPPFMRRANTTFVNLRSALDDVDPLVEASKPAVRRLGPFLTEARGFAADGEPTIRDLSRTIRSPGGTNDLIELMDSFPPLERAALERRRVNGAVRRGAFPETSEALRRAAPTISLARPYTPDFVGWLDDFSTTGAYDAIGGFSRAWINFSEILYGPGPKLRQFRRCPGANELPARDRSNVFSAEEQARLGCDGSQRSVTP